MLALVICLALFVVLMATRSRVDASDQRLREQGQQLAQQARELAELKRSVAELRAALETRASAAAAASAIVPEEVVAPAQPGAEPSAPIAFGSQAAPAPAPATSTAADAPVEPAAPSGPLAAPWPAADGGTLSEPPPAAASGALENLPVPNAPQLSQPPPPPAAGDFGYREPSGPDPVAQTLALLRELFLGGNTVVRAGILVLLVGVVLLLRWAAEHALFPIELRLGSVAILAMGLTLFGFNKRNARPGFARALQGGGIAALYLVVFFAFRSYELLPAGLAFALLCTIAICSGVLAVVQDSMALILIGQLFGFAAPLLASTGKGSHVALFSYYLLLNVLVFAVAWFKAWRALNLLGFLFTFGVATAWGALRYEPALFASTEPFLIAFLLLYVAIPVLFALRHPGTPRGWVDGSLVFGTPLAALGLQWALVHDVPFGMAYSALGLGALYLGLALMLRRYAAERLTALFEAFLPVGVGFATLAIPYGFDNHNLTGAAWALEGAGLYWVGVRQQRRLSRLAGVLLQLLAGGALLFDLDRPIASMPILNGWFLAGALLGSASLFVAQHAHARRSQLPSWEWHGVQLLIPWGYVSWQRAALVEIDAWAGPHWEPGAQIAWFGLFALALERIAARQRWLPGRWPGLLLWPGMAFLLCLYAFDLSAQPFSHAGWLGWPVYALAMGLVLHDFIDTRGARLQRWSHAFALWLWNAFGVLLWERLAHAQFHLPDAYVFAAGHVLCVAVLLWVLTRTPTSAWPLGPHRALYWRLPCTGLVLHLLGRGLLANLSLDGDSAPLPYLPLLNPIDVAQLLGFAAVLLWPVRARRETLQLMAASEQQRWWSVVALLAFVWWNALLARSVHQYQGVALDFDALYDAPSFQVACSLSWTLIALSVMTIAHKQQSRPPWLVGATLLTVVVAKLFLHDLEHLGTPAKIVSFLGVGALLLLVGYVAPVPPRAVNLAAASGEPREGS